MPVPKIPLPTGSKPLVASDVAPLLRWLQEHPLLDGELKTGLVTDGSTSVNYFQHGLGRAFRGAFCVGQNQTSVTLRVMSPQDMVENSQDPTKTFGVRASSATAVTANFWVY